VVGVCRGSRGAKQKSTGNRPGQYSRMWRGPKPLEKRIQQDGCATGLVSNMTDPTQVSILLPVGGLAQCRSGEDIWERGDGPFQSARGPAPGPDPRRGCKRQAAPGESGSLLPRLSRDHPCSLLIERGANGRPPGQDGGNHQDGFMTGLLRSDSASSGERCWD